MVQQYVAAGSSPAGRSYMQQPSKTSSQKRNNAVPFVRPSPFGGAPATQYGFDESSANRPHRTSIHSEDGSQPRPQAQQGQPLRSSFAWMPAELANEGQDFAGSPGSGIKRPYSLPANSAVSFYRRTEGFDAPAEEARPAVVTFSREPSLQRMNSSGFSSLTRQLSSQNSSTSAHAASTTAIRTSSFSFTPHTTDAQKVQLQKCLEKSSSAHGASPPDEAVALSEVISHHFGFFRQTLNLVLPGVR